MHTNDSIGGGNEGVLYSCYTCTLYEEVLGTHSNWVFTLEGNSFFGWRGAWWGLLYSWVWETVVRYSDTHTHTHTSKLTFRGRWGRARRRGRRVVVFVHHFMDVMNCTHQLHTEKDQTVSEVSGCAGKFLHRQPWCRRLHGQLSPLVLWWLYVLKWPWEQ